jgi:hypothetical protein
VAIADEACRHHANENQAGDEADGGDSPDAVSTASIPAARP